MMFTLGAVGIARVAIERDRTYALGYAGVLGLATYVALLKFVDSPLFSLFIIAVIAYLADVIVRDCTLIDDEVDASDQGLIDSGRLLMRQTVETAAASKTLEDDANPDQGKRSSTSRRAKKAHQPGRTVMYLALAALPLFGLGQFWLRNQPDIWSRARWLLAFYLFASLSLLVTTSFLGLRRYLRQREVEMPGDVTVGWIGGGLAMIALVLTIAYLAPLPGRALATFEPPKWLDSPGDTVASRFGWGNEGAEQSRPGDASTSSDSDRGDQQSQGIKPGQNAPAGDVGEGNRKQGPTGQQSGDSQTSSQSSQSQSSQSQSSQSQSPQSQSSQSQSSPSQSSASQSSPSQSSPQGSGSRDQQDASDSRARSESSQPSESQDATGNQTSGNQTSGESDSRSDSQQTASEANDSDGQPDDQGAPRASDSGPRDADPAASQSRSTSSPSNRSSSDIVGAISGWIKMLVFLVLTIIVAAFVWLHRDLIANWWRSLFGGTETTLPEQAAIETVVSAPPRPFASFRNPIGVESDQRKIVVVTFQAFEAWTREQGTPRNKDETPAEFLRRLAKVKPQLASSVTEIVDAYNRIVYGRGRATQQDLQAAKRVWQMMG